MRNNSKINYYKKLLTFSFIRKKSDSTSTSSTTQAATTQSISEVR